jgi:hypothetical protein
MPSQLALFPIGHDAPLRARDRPPEQFPHRAEVSNRFLWDNGNYPYVCCNVSYLSILELTVKKSNRFKSNIEFVTLKLTSQDKTKFDDWATKEGGKIFKMLVEVNEGGYKVSISPDFQNSCVIASITGTDNSTHNVGLCMTSRAEDVQEALMVMCYKHFVMADGGDWLDVAGKNEDNWG